MNTNVKRLHFLSKCARLRELDVQRLCYLDIDMKHVNRQSVMIANKELHARNAC